MNDLLFVGDAALFDLLAPTAKQEGVRLHHAQPESVNRALSAFAAVLDGALVSPEAVGALLDLRRVAPRLPVAVLDAQPSARPEALEGALNLELAFRGALAALAEAAPAGGDRPAVHPAALARPGAPDCWTAHACFRLSGVASPRDAAEAALLSEGAARWHLALADALACLPEAVSLRVRYAAVEGRLRAGLIVSTEGESPEASARLLADAVSDLAPLLRHGAVAGGAYVLDQADPSPQVSDTSDLLVPLRARTAVVLDAPSAEDLLPLFDVSLDEAPLALADGDTLIGDDGHGLALPMTGPDGGALAPLLRLLLDTDVPAMVEVSARPAPLGPAERERARGIARRAAMLMHHAPFNGPRRLAQRCVQLALEGARALALQVFVASEADRLPAALVTEAARCFVGDPATVSALPARASVQGGLLLVERIGMLDPMSERGTPDEAARRLRLPDPGLTLPGLAASRPARSFSPTHLPPDGFCLGRAADGRAVRLSPEDLRRHLYALGSTGTGKSTMLATLIRDLLVQGRGVGLIDPHGDLLAAVERLLPPGRRADVVRFEPADPDGLVRLNPLEYDPAVPGSRSLLIEELFALFSEWWDMRQAGGPMFESYMRNALLLAMQDPDEPGTLEDVARVFRDDDFRAAKVAACSDELVRDFWREAERTGGEAQLRNVSPYVTSKLSKFLYHDHLRRLVAVRRSSFDVRRIIDEGKILLVRLPKGRLGAEGTRLFGTVLLARLLMAALGREDTPEHDRRDFTLLVDEAQSFVSASTAALLSEARKYRLSLVLANQSLGQLRPDVLDAVLGNVGSLIAFRPGIPDAERLVPYFAPAFPREELLSLENFTAAARLLIGGRPAPPFLLHTAPPA